MGLIGYARISTAEGVQVLDRQLDALTLAGCERVFEDRASGAKADRPGLAACLDFLRTGDVLVVLDLDRLGRLAGELITLIDQLAARGIAFRALNAPMDTTTPTGRAFLQIQAAFAEMERNVIRQRVTEGLAAARARGTRLTTNSDRTAAQDPGGPLWLPSRRHFISKGPQIKAGTVGKVTIGLREP
jgi:DNA invertase Pin-like site-specific DNA recombinase